MSLSHVILGWLNIEPMTGYDLNAIIEISTRHFWSSSQSQIYRTLSKIEEESWVTQEVIVQEDRPSRKVYHITDQGQNELERWLSSFHEPDPPRIAWLIQVFFAGQVSDDQIIAVLEEKSANLRARLGRIIAAREISAAQFSPDEDIRDIFYWMLTIDYGEEKLRSQIEWIERTLVKIRKKTYQGMTLSSFQKNMNQKEEIHEQ